MKRGRLLAAGVLVVASIQPVGGDQQVRGQQACLDGLNRAGIRLASAVARHTMGCVTRALAGALPPGLTVAHCVAADERRLVARAAAHTAAVEAARCRFAPDFGAASAAAVSAAVLDTPWIEALFGADLDSALAAGGGASCQRAVAAQFARIVLARLGAFRACVRSGLDNRTLVHPAGVIACYGRDDRRIARAEAGLARVVARHCGGSDVRATFPGACADATAGTLAACLQRHADCSACRIARASNRMVRSCHRFADGVATLYCGPRPATGKSIARVWNEEALAAIRLDLPRPPIHARNLFHTSVAMWDAWAAWDPNARGRLVSEKAASSDPQRDRAIAISFAAYRVLASRYALSVNAATTAVALAARMDELGLDPGYTTAVGPAPAALGNRIGAAVVAHGLTDGSNEGLDYADPTYEPVNEPLVVKLPGAPMIDPNRWQPLALDFQVSQNGIPIPGRVQVFVGPQWGSVLPFASSFPALLPSPPPLLGDPLSDTAFKQAAIDVLRYAAELTPDDGILIDISPAGYGNNPLGSNDGAGYPVNPVTGQPYAPQWVRRGDFSRVLAEFWADGPESETPPGHWNSLANYTSDRLVAKRIGGSGPVVDDLEWDVKLYLALNGAVHDAAIGSWGTKRFYDSARPISMIRYMGALGQSSDPSGPAYHPDGLPLVPGLVEVITAESSAPGGRHEALADHVGEIAVYSWPGEPANPRAQYSGVRWGLASTWVPYQRKTFVTPPFAGYTSGHSTFSRSAAEVLARITGSPYFPNGLGEYAVPQNAFLQFEVGPSQPLTLQWATYYDAADQAGQSRIWGGIHILEDDFAGRVMGSAIGTHAYDRAVTYFEGTADP